MVRLFSYILCVNLVMVGCSHRRIEYVEGEQLFQRPPCYKLDTLSNFNALFLDTSSLYRHKVDETRFGTNVYLKFWADGSMLRIIKFNNKGVSREDLQVNPRSVDHGRYVQNERELKIEFYYPQEPNPVDNRYTRNRLKGKIAGDTIFINFKNFTNEYIKVEVPLDE